MKTYAYLAEFTKNENKSYTVTFPDLPGCITEGANFHEAQLMAKEALELHLYNLEDDNEALPHPSSPDSLNIACGGLISMIQANMLLTRMEMDNKRISKNCTLPKWLIKAAENEKLNFSKILEAALYGELNIKHMINKR